MHQILGLILFTIGIHAPATMPSVKGDSTTTPQAQVAGITGSYGGNTYRRYGDDGTDIPPVGAPTLSPGYYGRELNGTGRPLPPITGRDGHEATGDGRTARLTTVGLSQRSENLKDYFTKQTTLFVQKEQENNKKVEEYWRGHQASFSAQLQLIHDTKKKTTVSTIQQNLTNLNTHRTDIMTGQINKLIQILQDIVARAATAKGNGADTSSVDAAVTAAQTAIAAAQAAVAAQAARVYNITITSETGLKGDVGVESTSLRADLNTTFGKIKDAYTAVKAAGQALGAVTGGSQ